MGEEPVVQVSDNGAWTGVGAVRVEWGGLT